VLCELTGTHLHAYLDGELDAAGAANFERHLQSCAACASELSSEKALRQTLAGAQLYSRASDELRSRIGSKLPADFSFKTKAPRAWRWAALAAALLLAALIGAEAVNIFRGQSGSHALISAAVDAHLRSLQPGHLTDVQSTDQHTVKPWFDGKVNFAPTVRDFPSEGFPLLGGRLDVLAGRSSAALVFGRRKHIVNVFVLESANATGIRGASEQAGYNTVSWQRGGLTYIAVSDVAEADLQQLRDLFLTE
jgi:anti-sigma factor RsiW